MDSKTLVIIGTIITIFFGVLASLIAWFCGGKELEGANKNAIRQMFNFEITFFIVAILLGWIPLLGQLVVFVLWIMNIIFAIQTFNSANNGVEIKVPAIEFIK